jgi:hypothetical protein
MTEAEKAAIRKYLADDPARMAAACRVIAQARMKDRRQRQNETKGLKSGPPARHEEFN